MSVGSRIKELREERDLTRNDFAKLIGVTVGAVSNYENEVSSPKEPILFKIIEVLGCDANYLFQDAIKMSSITNDVTIVEYNLIKKYRALDSHGKEMVDFTLEKEWERSTTPKNNIVELRPHTEVKAAHERTDIEVTDEMKKHDDDIMNDDSEWN